MESLDSSETRLKCKEFSIVCCVFACMSVRLSDCSPGKSVLYFRFKIKRPRCVCLSPWICL